MLRRYSMVVKHEADRQFFRHHLSLQYKSNTNRVCKAFLTSSPSISLTRSKVSHTSWKILKRPLSSDGAVSASSASKKKEGSTVSDLFLDNLGTMFLSAIGVIIAGLVRSSYGTSNRIAAREALEKQTELDPLEIHELRLANGPEFNTEVMKAILAYFSNQKMTYDSFVSHVLNVMRNQYDEKFTIQLGHLLDRVATRNIQDQKDNVESFEGDNDGKLDLDLLLTILSLALDSSVADRVDILFQIMQMQQRSISNDNDNVVSEAQILRMIDILQRTCQLVPDAQILETEEQKYPLQQYHVATPNEMLSIAKTSQKEKLSQQALENDEWDCHDFHIMLRSKAICAWGECYNKTKLMRKASDITSDV